MFYFTCNESKIYESFTFWNKLQEFFLLFHDILIYWDAPVNAVPLNFLLFKESRKSVSISPKILSSSTVFNIDNTNIGFLSTK